MERAPSLPERVEVLVVGAGTAGAAFAAAAAGRGLDVLCVDRGGLEAAGARWVNGVTRRAFEEAGVPPPAGEELRGDGGCFHLIAGWGPSRLTMRDHGVLDVDMRLLVERLQMRARQSGATLLGEVSVEAVEKGYVRTSAGTVRAETVVDASGLSGARLLGSPVTPRSDLCTAAQAVHGVGDRRGARAFLERYEAEEGETLCFTGLDGGYSILNVSVDADEVSILTGSIAADGHASGRAILERFVAGEPWIGARRFGGSRAIPLGRPHDKLTDGRVVALGDAARQVFSAHGSGIGAGLVAARELADALADGGGPLQYAVAWMRRHGGLFAAYDLFRRFSQTLRLEDLVRLIQVGLLDAEMAAAGLGQRLPPVRARTALTTLGRLPRLGGLGVGLARRFGGMSALIALYAVYPREPRALSGWTRAVEAVYRRS